MSGLTEAVSRLSSLPESERRLQRKFNEYLHMGYECFISKKFLNKNSAKVDSDEKEGLLAGLMAHHNNLDNAFIAKAYNAVAEAKGWEPITASAIPAKASLKISSSFFFRCLICSSNQPIPEPTSLNRLSQASYRSRQVHKARRAFLFRPQRHPTSQGSRHNLVLLKVDAPPQCR